MKSPADAALVHDLAQACGLQWPLSRRRHWWRDAHTLAALAAALPAWLLLGHLFGDRLHVPRDGAAWLGFVLTRPALEELVFRGVLQGQLRRWTRRRVGVISLANVLTSCVFAAAHLATQPVIWALAVFAPSLVFGHLRERFRSVLPSMVMHMVYNAGFAVVAWLSRV